MNYEKRIFRISIFVPDMWNFLKLATTVGAITTGRLKLKTALKRRNKNVVGLKLNSWIMKSGYLGSQFCSWYVKFLKLATTVGAITPGRRKLKSALTKKKQKCCGT